MEKKNKKLLFIFILYWFMLAYILAALIWWFIELNNQSRDMALLLSKLDSTDSSYIADIESWQRRKSAQYWGEGITFFLLLLAGAAFFFRAIRRQFKISQQQQNFMMAVTHELKTPIAVSRLNLETIQKRELEEEKKNKLIANTLEELARMNALSSNLLFSSKMEAGGYKLSNELTDLKEIAKSCIRNYSNRFPDREINLHSKGDNIIRGDFFLLELLVNNLIDNAIKYSPRDKAIQVEIAEKSGNFSELRVTDHGAGVPDEDKKRIFEKFFRLGNKATQEAKGTGLGLYLVKRIAAIHNGQASVQDFPEGGSSFIVNFPLAT